METRLDLLSQDLANQLSKADEETLREIVNSVCIVALEHTNIRNPLVERFNSIEKIPISHEQTDLRRELLRFVEQLDGIQWDLKEQVERGKANIANYLQAFCDARVFNALYYALDPNPYVAAAETIYETHAATNDLYSLETIIAEIIN